jgi:hypothetical protein
MSNDEVLKLCRQIAARMDVMEKFMATATTQKDVAPMPARDETPEHECPPGFGWDDKSKGCLESQPAPAMEKASQATPAKLVKERDRRIAQGIL